jgi:aspartyl aminopeptidase
MLRDQGFVELKEKEEWAEKGMLQKGGKYFYNREGSTLVAFTVGGGFEPGNGFKVVGSHTDSPVLKVKPVSKIQGSGYMQLGVECYGGGLWHTWLDRDLSLAGMLVVAKPGGGFEKKLVHIKRPLLRIPSLCIHLQTPAEREKLEVNKENHLVPILAMINDEINKKASKDGKKDGMTWRHAPELVEILAEEAGCSVEDIRDMDMTLYDTQPGQVWGSKREFFSSARIDNQAHVFTGLQALVTHANDALAEVLAPRLTPATRHLQPYTLN